jgi:hypothetical protein
MKRMFNFGIKKEGMAYSKEKAGLAECAEACELLNDSEFLHQEICPRQRSL